MRTFIFSRSLRLALLAALLIIPLAWLGAGSADAAGQSPLIPGRPLRGQAAIDALAAHLPEVAAAYNMTPAQLSALFLNDQTLHVSNSGELFYADVAFPSDQAFDAAGQEVAAAAPFPDSQTFLLNSRPGADHTIYLDFDGHTTVGTTWNSAYGVPTIVSPPYDIDGDPGTFNATEIERIQKTWQIVAEDYSPFDVNVTTQDPGAAALSYSGSGDTQWGTRVVITDDTFANCNCGGHAYIGSFDDPLDEPVFVYNASLVGVSEASTHEAGHALYLSHDGTSTVAYYTGHGSGATSWAPLMGASYYVSVSQWSRGEYYDANNGSPSANYGNGPDDLAIIASLDNGNGFGYRPDDHGDDGQSATPLAVNGTAVSGAGVVEQTGDVDVFSFATGAGQVSLSVTPAVLSPNLDVLATLYDAGWNQVAVANPASILSASLNPTLAQGVYYLVVDGTGTGDPFSSSPTGYTEYASLGQYTISGAIVDNNNDPPAFNADPLVKADAVEDAPYGATLAGDAADPNGDPLTFVKLSGPAWLSLAPDGSLSGTPTNEDVGLNSWTVQVGDGYGGTDTATLEITVINTNDPPAFNSDPLVKPAVEVGSDYGDTLAGDASDPDGDSLTFAKLGGPDWLIVAPDGALSGAPADSDAGLNSWTVQVGDGHGGFDTAALEILVTEPVLFLDFVAAAESTESGTAGNTYVQTWADDGALQTLTEVESGGKPSRRHSLLSHTWTFNVQSGAAMVLYVNAWAPLSADGDSFAFSYSTDGLTFTPLGALEATADDGSVQPFELPAFLNGAVYVRLQDTEHTEGSRALDTVYVDHLYIRSDTGVTDPPAAPSNLTATAVGAGQIDLSWTDNAGDELGFRLERAQGSPGGYVQIAELGPDVTQFSDTTVAAGTTYYYRLLAYNGGGPSGYSNEAGATTGQAGTMHVALMEGLGTPADRNRWTAEVTITIVNSAGDPVAGATVEGAWSDGASGGATCLTDAAGQCTVSKANLKSNVPGATFTVTGVQHANYNYDAGANVQTSVIVAQP